MTKQKMNEWRAPGARNFIRVGDVVKVAPSAPGKRDGFEAKVIGIEEDQVGVLFTVVGGCRGRFHTRSFRPERISRVAQVRGGERRERKR